VRANGGVQAPILIPHRAAILMVQIVKLHRNLYYRTVQSQKKFQHRSRIALGMTALWD